MKKRVQKSILIGCLRLMLKPLVGFCFRHALRLQDIIDCMKAVFVEHVKRELEEQGEKVNVSRISIVSGVHRRDVSALLDQSGTASLSESRDLVAKVMGLWQTDEKSITKSKEPRVLTFGEEQSEFTALVYQVSRDLNPATVLFELERSGAIKKVKGGVKLVLESFVPKGDVLRSAQILSDDIHDLTCGVEENIFSEPEITNLHARTSYDSIRTDAIPEIKRWFLKEGHSLHSKARRFLSQFDQDVNPDPAYKGAKAKVVLGAFGRAEVNEIDTLKKKDKEKK